MDTESQTDGETRESYTTLIKELISATTDVVKKELVLAKEEAKEAARRAASHTIQTAIFGGLFILSLIPLTAFLVIGLGELLDNRYWLSSLIVGIIFAGIGGAFAYRAYTELKKDIELPKTRHAIEFDRKIIGNIRDRTTNRRAI